VDTDDIVENWHREARTGLAVDMLIDAYQARFGVIPPELRTVIEQTRDEATLRAWQKLILTRSAEEAAAAIRGSRGS